MVSLIISYVCIVCICMCAWRCMFIMYVCVHTRVYPWCMGRYQRTMAGVGSHLPASLEAESLLFLLPCILFGGINFPLVLTWHLVFEVECFLF